MGVNGHYAENSVQSQLPPSSYQNFLRHDRFIPGFVLSADRDKYILDSVDSLNDIKITTSASKESKDELVKYYTAVSKAVLSAITGYVYNNPESALVDYKFDDTFARQLVDCFFSTKWDCEYFKTIVPNFDEHYRMLIFFRDFIVIILLSKDAVRNFYIGTSAQEPSILHLVEAILVQALGETHATPNVNTGDQCETLNPGQSVYSYIWAHKDDSDRKWCYRTSMFVTKAKSPAFDEGKDFLDFFLFLLQKLY